MAEQTTESAYTAEQRVVADQYDAYLASDRLDPAWVAGWHAAINHATHALGRFKEDCTCGWGGVHDPDNPRCDLNSPPE